MTPIDTHDNPKIQRVCFEMVLLSLGILFLSMIWTWHIGIRANTIDHSLFHASESLKEIRKSVQSLERKLQ